MADLTVAEIDEQLTALRAAKTQRLISGVRTKTSYSGGSVEKQVASIAEIDGEIARLEVLRARLTGSPTTGGPIVVGFGDRY